MNYERNMDESEHQKQVRTSIKSGTKITHKNHFNPDK